MTIFWCASDVFWGSIIYNQCKNSDILCVFRMQLPHAMRYAMTGCAEWMYVYLCGFHEILVTFGEHYRLDGPWAMVCSRGRWWAMDGEDGECWAGSAVWERAGKGVKTVEGYGVKKIVVGDGG